MHSNLITTFIIGVSVLVQLVLGDPQLCPDPNTAKQLIYKEKVHAEAPSFGRTEKMVSAPLTGKSPSCIILTGILGGGSASITAVGISKDNVAIKLVSSIKEGIDGEIEVYTE